MRRRLIAVLGLLVLTTCGGDKGGPASPTPTTQTRIIELEGNMAFGTIPVGQSFEATLRIYNRGNSTLTITGMTGPSGFSSSWTNGAIAPGTSQAATIRFSPTESRTYSGTLTINGDQTSGTNTIAISGTGQRELFRKSGTGDAVFDMPADVARIHIIGTFNGYGSNFIVKVAGRLLVNVIIGSTDIGIGPRYDGTLLTGGGGVVAITNSSGVNWSFEEVR